jgi:uncharacterized protein YegP (UPF0339 family)
LETNVKSLEVYEAADGYRWRGRAGNGEIVCTGESHPTVGNAIRAAEGVFPGIPLHVEDMEAPTQS